MQTGRRQRGITWEGIHMIRLKNEKQIIRVQIWSGGAWRKNITGQVIGNYEGIVGVLLNSGEYIDVPEKHIRILKKRGGKR